MLGQRSPQGGGANVHLVPNLANIELGHFWRPGLIQKHAQSTGNHTARMCKKNLDQKFGLEKKLEQFFENKSLPSRNINQTPTKSHWKSLRENPSIWPWSVRGNHQNCSISELRRSWASYRCMNTSEVSCKQRFWRLCAMQGGIHESKISKTVKKTLWRSLSEHFKWRFCKLIFRF